MNDPFCVFIFHKLIEPDELVEWRKNVISKLSNYLAKYIAQKEKYPHVKFQYMNMVLEYLLSY